MALAGAVVLLATSTASASTPCPASRQAGSHTVSLVVEGRRRTALVHVPSGIADRRVALVLALHGYGGSGPRMESYSGFSRVSDRSGFVVAYPSSAGRFWNSTGASRLPDDVRFLGRLISYLDQTICLDPARVFATGVSNGGGMVALAGCELSSQIAAIATVAGAYNNQPACRPARPLSVLEIHGTADQVVPYFGSRHGTRDGLPPFVNGWVHRDGCRTTPSVRHFAKRTTSYRWGRCTGQVVVEHIKIQGGRHQWPGATPPDPGPRATFCASCTIWSFFSLLPTGARAWPPGGGAGL